MDALTVVVVVLVVAVAALCWGYGGPRRAMRETFADWPILVGAAAAGLVVGLLDWPLLVRLLVAVVAMYVLVTVLSRVTLDR